MNTIALIDHLHEQGLTFQVAFAEDGSYVLRSYGDDQLIYRALVEEFKNEIQAYYRALSNDLSRADIERLENYHWAVQHGIYSDDFTNVELELESENEKWSLSRGEPEAIILPDGPPPTQVLS